jgi:phosphoserine aminotransferase
MSRVLNFYPGPAALPQEALEEARDELLDWQKTGMSVLEISHRSKEFDALHNETIDLLKKIFEVPDNYSVLLLQGGATLQFAMIPMNLIEEGQTASYVVTGNFSKNAYKAAKALKPIHLACSTEKDGKYYRIPKEDEINIAPGSAYCHLTSNNTIFGTQWKSFPDYSDVPLACDMSSDILSRRVNFKPIGIIYAGAQKNLGPAGVTVVIIRNDLIDRSRNGLPDILSFKVLASKNSLFNTPCCFGIYMMNKVLKWVKKKGGLTFIEQQNEQKAKHLYDVIDENPEFFISKVEKASRSSMNVTFHLANEELEAKFVAEAKAEQIIGVKGHRSAGGIRVSIYNSNSLNNVRVAAQFMTKFAERNG